MYVLDICFVLTDMLLYVVYFQGLLMKIMSLIWVEQTHNIAITELPVAMKYYYKHARHCEDKRVLCIIKSQI